MNRIFNFKDKDNGTRESESAIDDDGIEASI